MTVASGTPLVLSVLSLVVSLVVGLGALLVARANVQRQLQVAAREAWMREFREQVAAFLANGAAQIDTTETLPEGNPGRAERLVEIYAAMTRSSKVIHLLLAEKGVEYATFVDLLAHFQGEVLEGISSEDQVTPAAVDILRRERAAIETDRAIRWQPWVQLKAWLRRDPPHWPN